jgi:hypothetical protein
MVNVGTQENYGRIPALPGLSRFPNVRLGATPGVGISRFYAEGVKSFCRLDKALRRLCICSGPMSDDDFSTVS